MISSAVGDRLRSQALLYSALVKEIDLVDLVSESEKGLEKKLPKAAMFNIRGLVSEYRQRVGEVVSENTVRAKIQILQDAGVFFCESGRNGCKIVRLTEQAKKELK